MYIVYDDKEFIIPSQEIKYKYKRLSKRTPLPPPLDFKVTWNTRLILNILYFLKFNPTVLELDFWVDIFFCSPTHTHIHVYIIQKLVNNLKGYWIAKEHDDIAQIKNNI
jgi:hypothetical protein